MRKGGREGAWEHGRGGGVDGRGNGGEGVGGREG